MAYFQRETRELVNLDSCELIRSQFDLVADYQAGVALDYFAEISEQMLPAAEANEKFFRLLLAVLDSMRGAAPGVPAAAGAVGRAVDYFSLWAVRLSGWLPEMRACLGCGSVLDDAERPERAFFIRGQAGLACADCRRSAGGSSWELSAGSRALAAEMLRRPVGQIAPAAAPDLRRFLVQQIEAHVERKLVTVGMLED
jgi:DNA repair protein RecO (recombination protein O)